MAYRPPPELKNKIENIKRKFEIETQPSKFSFDNPKSFEQSNGRNILSNAALKESSVNDLVCKRKEGILYSKDKLKTAESLSKGIKRTPAFRCEKLTNACQSPNLEKKSVVNSHVKLFEDKTCNKILKSPVNKNIPKNYSYLSGENQCLNFKHAVRSHLEGKNNNVRKCPNRTGLVAAIIADDKLSEFASFSQGEEKIAIGDKKGYTVPDVNMPSVSVQDRGIAKKNERIILKGSNKCDDSTRECLDTASNRSEHNNVSCSLKAALKAPLPPGPPPKKPPRTFLHNVSSPKEKSTGLTLPIKNLDVNICPTDLNKPRNGLNSSKTEPHVMLKKLETALLKHQQGIGSVVITPRVCNETAIGSEKDDTHLTDRIEQERTFCGQTSTSLGMVKKKHVTSVVSERKITGGCFESLNCVPIAPKHLYEKLAETQSEFFIESPLVSRKENVVQNQSPESREQSRKTSQRNSEKEVVYAEPYACVEVDTLLRGGVGEDLPKLSSKEQEVATLHYMSSPITPLQCLDAQLRCGSTDDLGQNNWNSNFKDKSFERNVTTADNSYVLKKEEVPLPQKSVLHFSNITKDVQNVSTCNKLDRSKLQLFINQAFGSPLHDSPVASLESGSSEESLPTAADMHSGDSLEEGKSQRKRDCSSSMSQDSNFNRELRPSHQDMSKLTEERKVYVRRVSSRIFNSRQRLATKPLSNLFHCIMLIGLNLDGEKRTKLPYIKSKYPVNASVPPLIEQLCFPDATDWPPKKSSKSGSYSDVQSYSLVITNEMGEHMFGYCRRVLPEGMDICLPLVYCILSPFRAKGFYFKILSELESQHGQPEWLQKTFIKELFACEFPSRGQTIKLSHIQGVPSSVEVCLRSLASQLRRPLDTRLEEHDLTMLFSALSVPLLLQVFGSLLLERKVLFISASLSKLSSCIEGLHSILYPFEWQYIFIPVLPHAHMGFCEAPTPFIIGLLKDKEGKSSTITLEEGIVIDVDEAKILHAVGDEATILPSRLKKCLKMALLLVESTTVESEPARNVLISEAFIRMFVEICGHYVNHMVTQQDGKKVFEKESFIKAAPLHSVQMLLEWFTETAMFSSFVESRLNETSETNGLFEQRALEHTVEMDKNTMLFLRNYKVINKKVKSLGDRLKDLW